MGTLNRQVISQPQLIHKGRPDDEAISWWTWTCQGYQLRHVFWWFCNFVHCFFFVKLCKYTCKIMWSLKHTVRITFGCKKQVWMLDNNLKIITCIISIVISLTFSFSKKLGFCSIVPCFHNVQQIYCVLISDVSNTILSNIDRTRTSFFEHRSNSNMFINH